RHEDCWVRIINEVDSGTPVQEVLEMAGGWWSEYLKEEARLAALAIERGGSADGDDGETVVVCTSRLYSQQCVPASQDEEDLSMEDQDNRNSSGEAAGADAGATDGMQCKDASNVDHQMDEDDDRDGSATSDTASVAKGDAEVSQQKKGSSADDHVMADGETDGHSGTERLSGEPHAGRAASTGQEDNAAAGNMLTGSRSNTPRPSPSPAPSQGQNSVESTAPHGQWEVLQKYHHLMHIVKMFAAFVSSRDLERLEQDVKTCLPPARYDSVDEFLGKMKVWVAGTGSPFDDAWLFFQREIAAAALQARADALEALDELL
ncbi:hypothetical protein BDR05DRAFT_954002, partial [Suillus weaverae]